MIAPTLAPASGKSRVGQAWLTRLVLNPAHRHVQRDLADAAALHRRVMSLVPDALGDSPRARAGVLFRLDTDHIGAPAVLVQTRIPPDPARLPSQYAHAQIREMAPMLNALRPGLRVRYRLLGNAVRRCGRNSTAGHWKQAIPLYGQEADQWWAQRATAAGLTLHTLLSHSADPLTARHRTTPTPATSAEHEETTRIRHAATLFDGTATVHDPEALRAAVLGGIGRSKSYGCGLLSLAPSGPEF